MQKEREKKKKGRQENKWKGRKRNGNGYGKGRHKKRRGKGGEGRECEGRKTGRERKGSFNKLKKESQGRISFESFSPPENDGCDSVE